MPSTDARLALQPGEVPASEQDACEPCPGCGDGDRVPAKGYWRCQVCDAEWNELDDETGNGNG